MVLGMWLASSTPNSNRPILSSTDREAIKRLAVTCLVRSEGFSLEKCLCCMIAEQMS